jgi:hypothetical protein
MEMRRAPWIYLGVLTVLAAAVPASAQVLLKGGVSVNVYNVSEYNAIGAEGEIQAGGPGIPWTPPQEGEWKLPLVCLFGWHHFEFGSTTRYTCGLRVLNEKNPKAHFFGEVQAGLQHDAGFNDFLLVPGGGVIVPMENKPYSLIFKLGFPIAFFEGGSQRGLLFSGGLQFTLN